MSSLLSSLSRTAMPRLSRTFIASVRSPPPPFRSPQGQPSARFSTTQSLRVRTKYPYARPQAPLSLWARMLFRRDGTPRDKWRGFNWACMLIINYLLYDAITTAQEFRAKNTVSENEVFILKHAVKVERAIRQLPTIDVDDPLALSRIVRDVYIALTGSVDSVNLFCELVDAYSRRNAREMKNVKIEFTERKKFLLRSGLETSSGPEKVKVLLAACCFETLEQMKIAESKEKVVEMLPLALLEDLRQVYQDIAKIIEDDMDSGCNHCNGGESDHMLDIID